MVQNSLDHLCAVTTAAADMTTEVVDGSVISRIVGNGDTSTFDPATDGLHQIAALLDMDVILSTTIATLASQTSFTLTAGSADNDVYNGCVMIIKDAVTATQRAIAMIADYTGSSKTVTLFRDAGIFTVASGDHVSILAPR